MIGFTATRHVCNSLCGKSELSFATYSPGNLFSYRSIRSGVESYTVMKVPRRRLFQLIMFVFAVAIVETGATITTALLVKRGAMIAIPTFTSDEVDDYFTHRNRVLGWGPEVGPDARVSMLRPREDPGFPVSAPSCTSAYGDSFTAGSEVDDDGAYPHHTGTILKCRVANYGVGGFGSDQAFMLMRAQSHLDRAPIVILGHVSENILRNVNQYRNLLYPDQSFGFKPRFLIDGNSLLAVPIAIQRAEDFHVLKDAPESLLLYDAFVSRPRRQFPYTLALLRWTVHDFHLRARLAGIPRHEPFYHPDHPAQGLQLTTRILSTFAGEARTQGRSPLVVLMPVGHDFQYARATGRWPDQPLADALRDAGIPVIHAGPAMMTRLAGEDPCHLFGNCSGHYNARGYRWIADLVAEAIAPAVRKAHTAEYW